MVEATENVYALSKALAKKEKVRADLEEQFQKHFEEAKSAAMVERERNLSREKHLSALRRTAGWPRSSSRSGQGTRP